MNRTAEAEPQAPQAPAPAGRRGAGEPVFAALLALVGMVLTTYGALVHAGALMAPGSVLILGGGAWLGNALARRDVRLLPASTAGRPPAGEDAA